MSRHSRHSTELIAVGGAWEWVCHTCGASAEDAIADEGDALDAADRHERDPFPTH